MKRLPLYAFIVVLTFPVYWMVIGSLQDIHGIFLMPPRIVPLYPTLCNYELIFSRSGILRWIVNSLVITAVGTALSVLVSILTAYAITTYKLRCRSVLLGLVIFRLIIPRDAMIIPLFAIVRKLGLGASYLGALVPNLFQAFGCMIMIAGFTAVPSEIRESARIDGAGEWRTLFGIVVPLTRVSVATVALFQGLAFFGDYVWQMLVLRRDYMRTLPVGLIQFVGQRGGIHETEVNPVGLQLAAGVILFIPLVLIFVLAQRHFIGGLTLGSAREDA